MLNNHEIAQLVKKVIDEKYNNSNVIYSDFQTLINNLLKHYSIRDLTEIELKKSGIEVAQEIRDDLYRLNISYIEDKLSIEEVNDFLCNENKEFRYELLNKIAKRRVTELVKVWIKDYKKKNKRRQL